MPVSRVKRKPDGKVHCKDFRELWQDVEPGSVDLILTDPPYGRDAMWVWEPLGLLALRLLKHDGLLVAYTGQMYLPHVLVDLSRHLKYHWTLALTYGGSASYIRNVGVNQTWKPIVVFKVAKQRLLDDGTDVLRGPGQEKDLHPWQQAEDEAESLVARFSKVGDLVVDPFVGSGTSVVAAARLGRRYVGCDVDPEAVTTTNNRLSSLY